MATSKKSILVSTFTALLSLVVLALPSAGQSYNAAGDFSNSNNPNGSWSYGWSSSLGSAFNLYSISTNGYAGLALNGWLSTSDSSGTPYVLKNDTAHDVINAVSVYKPGQLAEHPGAQDQDCIVRWTAPFSGTVSIAAVFSGLSLLGDSVDVHILYNGTSLLDSTVVGSPSPTSYSGVQSVVAGDTIDFAVGFGGGVINLEDTTALSATVERIPDGQFIFAFTNSPLWDVSGIYTNAAVSNDVVIVSIQHEVNGQLSGTRTETYVSGADHADGNGSITGKVKGKSGSLSATLSNQGSISGVIAGGSYLANFTGKGTATLAPSSSNLFFASTLRTCVVGGKCVSESDSQAISLPSNLDGTWTLELDIATSGTAVSGTATVTLSNGRVLDYTVDGNFNTKTDAASLRLVGTGGGTGSSLSVTLLDGGGALSKVKGGAFGQTLRFP